MNLRHSSDRLPKVPRVSPERVTERLMNTAAVLGGVATGLFGVVVGIETGDRQNPSHVDTHVIDSTVQPIGNSLDPSTTIETAIQYLEEKNEASYDTENNIQKEGDEVTEEILAQTGRKTLWPSDAVKIVLLADVQGNYYVDADPIALAKANTTGTSTDGPN